MNYRAGIHRMVDKIHDEKLLHLIYNFVNRYLYREEVKGHEPGRNH